MILYKKHFEDVMGKGENAGVGKAENAGNQHFLLFPVFSSKSKTKLLGMGPCYVSQTKLDIVITVSISFQAAAIFNSAFGSFLVS